MKREYALVAGIAVAQAAVKIGAGVLMIKALAVLLGPADLAYFGQAHSVYLLTSGAAAVFLGTGLVAALARHADRPSRRVATLQAADRASLVVVATLAVAALAAWVAFGAVWRSLVAQADALALLLVVGLAAQVLYTRSLSLLTAAGGVARYGALTTAYALVTAACVAGLAAMAGLAGSVAALAIASLAGALAGVVAARHVSATAGGNNAGPVGEAGVLRDILTLGAFGLVGALAPQACLIAVRALLIDGVSAEAAGIWHGMSRLSDAILGPVVTIVTLYFLPRYARTGIAGSGPVLRQGLVGVALPFAVLAAVLWSQREAVIRLAFTAEFAPMAQLFHWQLAGDVVRVAGWLFAYVLLGAGLTGWLVILELAHAAAYVGLVGALVPTVREAAGSIGYLTANGLYLLAVATLYAARRRAQVTREAPAR